MAAIRLRGHVCRAGAFVGTVHRVDNAAPSRSDGDLSGSVFVTDGRFTVHELWNLPSPCAVISAGGGTTSEEGNFISSGGRWGEIVVFANCVQGGLDQLVDWSEVCVSMTEDGDVLVAPAMGVRQASPSPKGDGVPMSTPPRAAVVASLDEINDALAAPCSASEALRLANQLLDMAGSDSVEEKYRVGELLSKAIDVNPQCVGVLTLMAQSEHRQARFTAARCMSKLVELHADLLPEAGVLALLERDLEDRSIPNLVARALGKGGNHPHVRGILKSISDVQRYASVAEAALRFEDDRTRRNYY